MVKVGKWIARHRILMLLIGVLLIIPSVIGIAKTKVNYDLLSYLPDHLETVKGQDILVDEFGTGAYSMFICEGMENKDVAKLKEQIEDVEHVSKVVWYDSFADISIPMEMLPEDIREAFNADDSTLMFIIFDTTTSADETMDAIENIRALAGKQCFLSGMSAIVTDTKNLAESEVAIYVLIAVVLSCIVLALTMESYLIPVFFLLSIGMAILYNMGTNIFMGQISYITKALSAVLQLGVTMDYSIFLLDAFMNYRKQGMNEEDAIINAVQEAINSIFASSLTTVVGFLALVTMKFSIGFDLGLVLAKGIVFSLLTVVFFMPAMILKFAKLNEKTKHRSFMPDFHGLGKAIYRIRPIVFAVIVLVTPLAYTAQGLNDFLYGNDSMGASEGTQVYEDDQQITKIFGRSNMLLALYPNTSEVNERAMAKEIKDLSYVKNVTALADTLPEGIPEEFLPKSTVELLHKDGYCRMLIYTPKPAAWPRRPRCRGIQGLRRDPGDRKEVLPGRKLSRR